MKRTSYRRLLPALIAAMAVLAIAPSVAMGAAKVTLSGGELRITETTGPLQLTVDVSDGKSVQISNAGGIADPLPPGCSRTGPNSISCPILGVNGVTVKGGDLFDQITIVNHPFFHPKVISLQTAGGDDLAQIGGTADEEVICDLGDGADVCTSGDADTTCVLGNGNDSCTSGAAADQCDAGSGNDRCSLGAGSDECNAGKGNDYCNLGANNDICTMGGGTDWCIGGPGRDSCAGNNGKDRTKGCEKGKP